MSSYRLDRLFAPRSVAIVGASPRPDSLGLSILRNLVAGGFAGRIAVVSPRHAAIEGIATVARIADLNEPPDLVVLATPPSTIPALVAEAGARGAAGAVVITAGLGRGPGSLADAAEKAARPHGLRLVGPNCLGLIVPRSKLNASFAARMPRAGDLALVSQSGAIVAGVVEWAANRALGFSAVASLGDKIDVDFADLLDFFAADRSTRATLLYVEAIKNARKFVSAARAAARAKPVVVIKAGRHALGAQAAQTHTGALAGADAVYDAAFRRAGLVRVFDLDELFDAAETLGLLRPIAGERLAILTNGGGVGVLAVDRLMDFGGTLAEISPPAMERLNAALPPTWSHANPVDIIGDASADRYGAALEALLCDPANDAVLVLNVPTMLASPPAIARRVAAVVTAERARCVPSKPVLAAWIGGDPAAAQEFISARIPNYDTESEAIRGFMHLARYSQAQRDLMRTPPALPDDRPPELAAARAVVARALAENRAWLDPVEVADLCRAYAIPAASATPAADSAAAAAAAAPLLAGGHSVAVKIHSHDIVHKSDVDGVRLNLRDADAVRAAADDIIARARALRPQARIAGVTVHPMIVRPKARELIAGIATDPTFGAVVLFGHGGTAVEVVNDKALALVPLDLASAQELIARTRIARLLKAYRNVPAADETAIAVVLVKLAQLAADFPEIREIDINPLLADQDGTTAIDMRVAVAPVDPKFTGRGHPHLAIRPYPKEWERHIAFAGARAFVRPVRPEDEPLFPPFLARVSGDDMRMRFFAQVKDFSHPFIARLTQIDYARAMAFVAIDEDSGELIAVVRAHSDADYRSAEYAILVRSDRQGRGLGWALMQLLIDYARSERLERIEGQVLAENRSMLDMCRGIGFAIVPDPEDSGMFRVHLAL